MHKTLVSAAAVALAAPTLSAQESQDRRSPTPQELEQRIEQLEKRQSEVSEENEDLRFQVESLEQEVEQLGRAASQPPAQRLNVFNPQLTVFGNFLARSDDQPVWLDDDFGGERIDDTLSLREVEVDLRAAIDPWADGVLILSSHAEVPGDYETGVEEGYLVLKKLPLSDSAPGGLKLKAGRFRPSFGRFNRIHLHDLPWVHYPRSLGTFLGPEGYLADGFSGQLFLPSPTENGTLEATAELLGGGGLPLDEDAGNSMLSGVARLDWFQELTDSQSIELGTSAWTRGGDRNLFGLDGTYKWKPRAGGQWQSFLVGGELYVSDTDDPAQDDASGYFAWAQYQFDINTYLGLRYDRSEELSDSSLVTNTWSTFLTYYTTEFLRFRLGLEHASSDVDELDGRNTAFLELNFVFGSHPVEPYWVNR